MNAFHGQQIIIVGGGGGLGSAIAQSMADAGGRVLLVGRTLESLQQVAKALGESAQTWQADLTDMDSLQALAKSHPQPDVVINATGYDVRKPFLRHTTED
ncbi:MAG TPA: SDR family NAD(P)-dependent oxidoreductase, partial [Aggregatilineales bacterium]|nr:SDR family NAD(P)-dependent oxidoreductase [Aggregatilineales bacterium]